jgi:hypothetical protein
MELRLSAHPEDPANGAVFCYLQRTLCHPLVTRTRAGLCHPSPSPFGFGRRRGTLPVHSTTHRPDDGRRC